jgi:uncharacterized protein (TIGR00369 family)
MGTLHGGVLCDIADAAMAAAYRTTLRQGERFTTVELKINFLRPVWNAKLRAQARVVRAGKLVGLLECDIFDEQRRLVARGLQHLHDVSGSARRRARPAGGTDPRSGQARNSVEQNPAHNAEHLILGNQLAKHPLISYDKSAPGSCIRHRRRFL